MDYSGFKIKFQNYFKVYLLLKDISINPAMAREGHIIIVVITAAKS